MVLVQKWPFFEVFFLGNIAQENVFPDTLERKNGGVGYKNGKLNKAKNWHFSKAVNPWFWSINGHFSKCSFWGNIGQANVFYDILERKNAYVGYKNKKSKSRKIDIFPKGLTHSSSSKMAFLKMFFFRQSRSGNVFHDTLERKQRLCWL